ncbi:MAG: cyclophilin-like fold protein [Spirochaetota bacterium]
MKTIIIEAGSVQMEAELRDTPAANAIWDALPLEGNANTWGDEIYFSTGLDLDLEADATDTMPEGSLAYWPPGKGFCILFGPTPASGGDGTPRLASESNPIGKVLGDPEEFKSVSSGDTVTVKAK